MDNKIFDIIRANKNPSYSVSNGKNVAVRCPYCGDSVKNPKSAHLYIEVNPPYRFRCFRCEVSGRLNQSVLRDLEIYSNDISLEILKGNSGLRQRSGKIDVVANRPKLAIFDSQVEDRTLAYLNGRFGTSFTKVEAVKYFKAVLDPLQFIKTNKINISGSKFQFNDSIGFISSDGTYVVFRDITNKQKLRYYNLRLVSDDFEDASKVYNIRSKVDVMKEKTILNIAEGAFDIIGIWNKFKDEYNDDSVNVIYSAAAGKSYNAAILRYIRMGFLDLEINIYTDSSDDVKFEDFRVLKRQNKYIKNMTINIIYNTIEKDFGVPKDRIETKTIRI